MLKPIAALALLVTAFAAAPAAASSPDTDLTRYRIDLHAGTRPTPPDAIPVRPAAPPPPDATGHSPDLGVKPGPEQARVVRRARARAAKTQTFTDPRGLSILLDGENPAVDLKPFAEVLAATYHFGEIENLYVIVTDDAGVATNCGSDRAVACYISKDPANSPVGTMVISYQDDDIVHTVFHEYGHHVDNQLYNLNERIGCRHDNDGSRRWFFTRDSENAITQTSSCRDDTGWSHLLGELFAEDYGQLSSAIGNVPMSGFDPRMPAPPPGERVLGAMKRDIDRPFVAGTRNLSGRFKGNKATVRVRLDAPSFLSLTKASEVRGARATGCDTNWKDVYSGTCKLTLTRKGNAKRFSIGVRVF